ncbi:MAG: tripartite tricarboxylate transporter permease [Bryobacterales bacterium]|jgi:putative tricarboxylic transport membrane protein|nr:tripartite tricarboxylate transporter permease [Bryobacterales bacterium]
MEALATGFTAILQPMVLLYLMGGLLMGALFGALPGLTATMGVALLTPITFWLNAEEGMAMLLGIYCGAIPAGGVPALLLNIPGTPASIAASWDGYPLSQRGEAGLALGINSVFGFIGQVTSVLFLAIAAFPIASFSLRFGPPEYFALALFGISLMAGVSGNQMAKGMLSGMLGLLVSTIGLDPMMAVARFTFGQAEFYDGIAFVPVMIGLFGVGEVFHQMLTDGASARVGSSPATPPAVLGRVLPDWAAWKRMLVPGAIGSGVGTVVGAIPAAGGDIAAVICWEQTRRLSRKPEEFGKGSIEGLAASTTACNSAIGGAMTTMLTLGIPGDAPSAILIGALLIHGVQPGPLLFRDNPALVYSIIGLMVLAALLIAVLGVVAARPLAAALRVPKPWLWTAILLLSVVGSYALSNAITDVWVMLAAGLLGLAFRWLQIPLGPLVLGLILGPMMESNLRRALILSRGDWESIFLRPIVAFLVVAALLSLVWPLIQRYRSGRKPRDPLPGPGESGG